MKKPSVPKCLGGSQKIFLGRSTSSLAVFYVKQVALNRHVRRHFRLLFLCALRPDSSSRKNSISSLVSEKCVCQDLFHYRKFFPFIMRVIYYPTAML